MTTSFDREPGAGLADDELPGYACMLHAYHRARRESPRDYRDAADRAGQPRP